MPRLHLRNFVAFVFFALNAGFVNAVTLNSSVNCPSDSVVGPVTVIALNYSDTITITASTVTTVALLPRNFITRQDNTAAVEGVYTGALTCTLTIDGVVHPFTRSLSLAVPPSGPTGTGTMTTGAVAFTMDLGSEGQLNVSAPAEDGLGFDRALANGVSIVQAPTTNTTLLLTQAAIALPALSTWGLAALLATMLVWGSLSLRRRKIGAF